MILWRFTDPEDGTYAAVGRRVAGAGPTTRPPVLEWEPASQIVGDFVWARSDASVVVVAKSVGAALAEKFQGFELASKPLIALPYHGPELADLRVTAWAHIDLERSDVKRSTSDDASYVVEGAETWETGWDLESMRSKRIRLPRSPGGGLYIQRSSVTGDIFGVHEFPSWIFCTGEVRTFVQRQEFTNVDFLEMGELF